MPRRAHDSSDSEADVRDRGAAAVSGARPLKRRRTTTGSWRPRSLVTVVRAGEQAVIAKIFNYLHPEELLALSFTCRDIRSLLRAESSARIWRQARANAPGPTPPRCPNGLSQMAWTALLWQKKCSHCWARTTREVDWGLRRRFCADCQQKNVKSQLNMPKLYKGLSTDVFRLVPYSRVARSGIKTQYYWEPELEDVYNALKRLDERVRAGNPRAEEKRARYISDRKRYVDEVLDAVHECEKWQKQCQERRTQAQARLREKVVNSLVNMGYDVGDVEDVLREARITEASVSDWNAFLRKYQPELDSRQRPLATVSSTELLRSQYRRLLKTQTGPARGWGALVPFGDILAIPGVRSLLKRVSVDNVADLAKRIPAFVDTWREDVEAQLLSTLPPPPKGVRKADAENPERLKLASSVWRRGDDPIPLTWPHMVLVPHVLCLDRQYGELKYATPSGSWSMNGMEYDVVAAHVVREFCKLAFLDYSTATVAVLDHSALRLQCTLCRDVWPLVLSWRQAIRHLHDTHANSGSGSWKPFPSTIEGPVAMIEAGLEVWACAVSACTRPHRLRNLADIEQHLQDKHSVGRPTRGKQYIRAPTAPLSEPLNLLELYAESKDDAMYECRTCGRSTSLDRMLEHLRNEHGVHLTSGAHADRATIDSNSEDDEPAPRGTKRHISISSSSSDEAAPPFKKQAVYNGLDSPPPHLLPAEPVLSTSDRALGHRYLGEDGVRPSATVPEGAAPSSEMEDIEDDVLAGLAHDIVGSKKRANVAHKPEASMPQADQTSSVLTAPLPPQFVCMRCTRAIDRFRHMPEHSILHHLATRHYLVDPALGLDYSTFDMDAQVWPEVMPWSNKKVYTCLLCEGKDEPINWNTLEHHLITSHKIVDPVAKRDFDGPSSYASESGYPILFEGRPAAVQPRESAWNANNRPTSPTESDDSANRSDGDGSSSSSESDGYDNGGYAGGGAPEGSADREDREDDAGDSTSDDEEPLSAYREARRQVRSYIKARRPEAVDACSFFCLHCPQGSGEKRKRYNLNGVLCHLASPRHAIDRPRLKKDYQVVQRKKENYQVAQRKTRTGFRFECLHCDTGKLFNENGMRNHLADKHGYDDPSDLETEAKDTFLTN